MKSVICVTFFLIFQLILNSNYAFAQLCEEINAKIKDESKRISEVDRKYSDFLEGINTNIANIRQENDECTMKLNKIPEEFKAQTENLSSKFNNSHHLSVNNTSNEVEIIKSQNIEIINLQVKITHLNNIVRYFDAKFRILERRTKLKENDKNYQEQLQELKSQIEIMKIMMYAVFGIFLVLKLMIICKWCCCMFTKISATSKYEEIEMTSTQPTTKSNVYENANQLRELPVYENTGYTTTKSASIGGRKYSNQFQNTPVGTLPKIINNLNQMHDSKDDDYYSKSADEFYNNPEHDDSQIYDTCEFDDSKGNLSKKLNIQHNSSEYSNFPPPPKDLLYDKNLDDDEIYYDEFNDGLTDEAIYDYVARDSLNLCSKKSKIPVLAKHLETGMFPGGSGMHKFHK